MFVLGRKTLRKRQVLANRGGRENELTGFDSEMPSCRPWRSLNADAQTPRRPDAQHRTVHANNGDRPRKLRLLNARTRRHSRRGA